MIITFKLLRSAAHGREYLCCTSVALFCMLSLHGYQGLTTVSMGQCERCRNGRVLLGDTHVQL
jgi:hypothetical protein